MSYTYFAFFMGLFGSIHCAVMCGPLIFAIEGRQGLSWAVFLNKVLYQLGRVLTYGSLGFLLGTIGTFAQVQGWQRALSWITGVLLVLIAVVQLIGKNNRTIASLQTRSVQPVVRLLSKWLYKPGEFYRWGIERIIALWYGLYGSNVRNECGQFTTEFPIYAVLWIGDNSTPVFVFLLGKLLQIFQN
ncbi:sulfite exporter TauE/SafE family protein [Sphingobacterium sp. E70]|nr:sulfite exporter TauE/SafE family protein [Sphingobacterium sp. E70]